MTSSLRPPRSSVSSAYLSHLQRKKQQSHDFIPPRSGSLSGSSGASSERTQVSLREEEEEQDRNHGNHHHPDRPRRSWDRTSKKQDPQQQQQHRVSTALTLVPADLGSYELGEAWQEDEGEHNSNNTHDDDDDEEEEDTQQTQDNTDSSQTSASFDALSQLLEETSRRWQHDARVTHRAFCRLPNCPRCRQAEADEEQHDLDNEIIAQQQAEIQALRAQLSLSHHYDSNNQVNKKKLNNNSSKLANTSRNKMPSPISRKVNHKTSPAAAMEPSPSPQPSEELPMEQIEVYHGDDDCNVSVTSGLTNLYPDHQSTMMHHSNSNPSMIILQQQQQQLLLQQPLSSSLPPLPPTSILPYTIHRPDAETHQETFMAAQPPPQVAAAATPTAAAAAMTPPSPVATATHRVRQHTVTLVAADGSVRNAIYSGPMLHEKPHGVGVLTFCETGDMYFGDLCLGEMHGQGTYTFHKDSKNKHRKCQVLKGTFQNNVFTEYEPNNNANNSARKKK